MSIVYEPLILEVMESGIGAFVRQRRAELGLSQTALAGRSGISKGHLSTIEAGKIALPAADIRRRLSKALGVSHLDLLVASGEITPEEIRDAGAVGVIEREPNDLRAQLHRAVDAVLDWNDAPGIARSVLWTMQGVAYDQTPHPAAEVSEPPRASSGRGFP